MNIDRILIRSNHRNTITFHRGYQPPRKYTIKTADAPRLYHIFNNDPWPAHTEFLPDGTIEVEYCVSDLELPEVEHDEEFWAPPLDPDPLDSYRDYLETMADEVAATRS